MTIPAEMIILDPDANGTLQSRIQERVAEAILSGRFRAGERLPSSRALARHLGVSRITVTLAYGELLSDDYLTSRGRSGYYVSEDAPRPADFSPAQRRETVDWSRAIGQRFSGAMRLDKPGNWRSYRYPFIYGQADETLFDHANWRLSALRALGQRDFDAMTIDYNDADDPRLVDFIVRHILPRRGIAADADEVLITLGAQNALWLTTQVLLTQRRTAAFENPCYPALREILSQSRCHLAPVPVDAGGLQPEAIPTGTHVVFATPSHQCPTTTTMPMARRRALLKRARTEDFLIVEDDYEFEMAFQDATSPALKSLDRDGRVIYVGSFSKSLFPGLRLGYLVGSPTFIAEARALRATVLRHPPGVIQRTAAHFLSLGHYDALIRRMGRAYSSRRKVMEASIRANGLTMADPRMHGGSSFWMRAPQGIDTDDLARALHEKSVLIEPGRPFFADEEAPANFYRLAYSSIPEDRIAQGVGLIAAEIHK
jgi:GntR family transcriptional regulator / MocR family aminotransferase